MFKANPVKRRLFGGTVFAILFLFLTTIFLCDRWIENVSATLHTDVLAAITPCEVALVLGCTETLPNGRSNLYFTTRMDAAALLYSSGKCRYLIVSGDNGHKDYDEPTRMMSALAARGVPKNVIYCDFAGFSTLDSIIRAAKIFRQQQIIVVSQRFHNERAIYIARHKGMTAQGFNAKDVVPYADSRPGFVNRERG